MTTSITSKSVDEHGNRGYKVTTEPAVEPMSIAEFKLFSRVDNDDEDALLTSIITGIRRATERYLNRALITQTITLRMDFWPAEAIELPMPPLATITSVGTLDEDDVLTTYSSDNYFIDTISEPGKLVIKNGVTPPCNTNRYYAGYQVIYTAGYGAASTDIPESIVEAMKAWATLVYENRVPIGKPPMVAKLLMDSYKMYRL